MHEKKKKRWCVHPPVHAEMGNMLLPLPYWSILMSVCILTYDGPRHCAGPKLTCEDSVNSLWQSISSWQRHYSSAGREPAAGKHGNWHLQYDSSQHSHHHLPLSLPLTQLTHRVFVRHSVVLLQKNSQLILLIGFHSPPPFLLNLSCCAGHREEKKEEITFDKCTLTNRTNTQQR